MSSSNNSQQGRVPERTALYSLHERLQARLVDFAGYSLPLQYANGIKAEHLHVRQEAGLFDVSHMGQIRIVGGNVAAAMESLVCGDIDSLAEYQQRYTLLTNEEGGIIDDLMVTRVPEGLFLVVNAANKYSDFSYIQSQLELTCRVEMMEDYSLLALQGPAAVSVLDHFDRRISDLTFMRAGVFQLAGTECLVHRCGYTGEDGFEISIHNDFAAQLAEELISIEQVQPIGLGARDSLRLEAGLCLHGHDIDASTSPIEAALNWAVAAKYRNNKVSPQFPGAGRIMQELKEGTSRLRVGLRATGKQPVREGSVLLDEDGEACGRVSSGGFGPSCQAPVAMGYVDSQYAAPGTELGVKIRDRFHTIRVAELPFVEHRYHKA